jgi:hypothetical protein
MWIVPEECCDWTVARQGLAPFFSVHTPSFSLRRCGRGAMALFGFFPLGAEPAPSPEYRRYGTAFAIELTIRMYDCGICVAALRPRG